MHYKRTGVYTINFEGTDKIYVGSSADLYKRKSQHFKQLREGTHSNRYLQRVYNKYSSKAVFKPIIYCGVDSLLTYEQQCIDFYKDSGLLLNLCLVAGSSLGRKLSPDHIANAAKGWKESLQRKREQGIPHHSKGKKIPPEVIEKMLATKYANKLIREANGEKHFNAGRKMTSEHIAKREASRAENRRILQSQGIQDPCKGRKQTPEHVKKAKEARAESLRIRKEQGIPYPYSKHKKSDTSNV